MRNFKLKAMNFLCVIPARYSSTRFPGKPLAMLGGKFVVQWVYERVASVLDNVWVATDDDRISEAVRSFGGKAVITSSHHRSGTDRIREAVDIIGANCDVAINVQGDEPFVSPSQIKSLCSCFEDDATQIATLAIAFKRSYDAINNPNSPKVVVDNYGYAMYFSRSVIPFVRGREVGEWPAAFPFLKHIGLYGYRKDVLKEITELPPSSLEVAESLEQLRWLQNGYKIKVGITDIETIGIDTPDDLKQAEAFLSHDGDGVRV